MNLKHLYCFLLFLFITCFIYLGLSSGHNRLDEMVLHVLLEVEVGKLVLLAKLEKLGELVVGDDLATVLGVLELVGADVGVYLLANRSAGHLSAGRLTEELGELVADTSGLNKSRRLAVTGRAPLLGAGLLRRLELAAHSLLECLEIVLKVGEKTHELLKLGAVLRHLGDEGGCAGLGGVNDGSRGGIDYGGDHRGCLLLCARSLGGGGGGNDGGNRGGNILGGSDHFQGCIQINASSF